MLIFRAFRLSISERCKGSTALNPVVTPALVLAGMSALMLPALAAEAAVDKEPELERVVLSTGGVGYFEYEAQISGSAEIPIEVRLDQVDDVLKSLVVYDQKGTVGLIRLPGKAPLDEAFRDLPFPRTALNDTSGLLNALSGAEVIISGDKELRGRLVNVTGEFIQNSNGSGSLVQHRVSLLTDAGLQSTVLERSTAVRFADQKLQKQIDEALLAVATNRKQDRRSLSLTLSGEGKRPIRVGYVVEAPLWKASYRLTVTEGDASADGQLLGWAILENLSGLDWKDVDLVVTSGNPVTFKQALYESYYVSRPSIPVEVLGRIMPPKDDGAVAYELAAQNVPMESGGAMPLRPQMKARAMGMTDGFASREMAADMAMAPAAAPMPMSNVIQQAQIQAAESQDAATQVIFRYPQPVTVDNGQSVMLPIISGAVKAEQVSLYNPSTHATHPLASVRLTNDGDFGLPPGVVTLFTRPDAKSEVNFAGDAQLTPLPSGDDRLLSFALDQKVSLVPSNKFSEQKVSGSIADGIFKLNVRQESSTTYKIENNAAQDRKLLIEYPKQGGWNLAEPKAEGIEETAQNYRVPVTVEAGKTREFRIMLERPVLQHFELGTLDGSQIAAFATARELSDPVRQAMARLADYKQRVEERLRALQNLDAQIQRRSEEQERVRRMLTSVPSNSDIYRRYLSDLNKQEDEMQRLQSQRYDADSAHEKARSDLLEYVRGLKIDTR